MSGIAPSVENSRLIMTHHIMSVCPLQAGGPTPNLRQLDNQFHPQFRHCVMYKGEKKPLLNAPAIAITPKMTNRTLPLLSTHIQNHKIHQELVPVVVL